MGAVDANEPSIVSANTRVCHARSRSVASKIAFFITRSDSPGMAVMSSFAAPSAASRTGAFLWPVSAKSAGSVSTRCG